MSEKAYINPEVIVWARETAKISKSVVALKLSISIDKLSEWESGSSYPTIKQAQALAKLYKRPFSLFFLPDVPKDFQPLKDFRLNGSKEISTATIFIIREIQQKQAWISDLKKEQQEEKLKFVGKFNINSDFKEVSSNILSTLSIDPTNYQTDNPIKEWIRKAESIGIYISRASYIHSRMTLDSDEIQGFAISDEYAPFIFINSEDWSAPQLFTLVHELAHIWIAETGISSYIDLDEISKNKYDPIEVFCNNIAANALMPNDVVKNIDNQIYNHFDEVFKIAKSFGVSTFTFLYRAYNLGIIKIDKYNDLKKIATYKFNEFVDTEELKRKKLKESSNNSGGPNYYLIQLNRNSRQFTHIVLNAYRGGIIEPTEASGLLNIHVNKFNKLEEQLYK